MKLWQILLLILLVIKSAKNQDIKLVVRAISEIIKEAFVKKSERIEIITIAFGRQRNFDVMNEVLRVQQHELDAFPIEIRHIDLTQPWDNYLNKSAIIFLESPEALQVLNPTVRLGNKLPKSFKFLIYNEKLAKLSADELIGKIVPLYRPLSKMSILSTRNGLVELNAFSLSAPGACRRLTLFTINTFSERLQNWETKDFFVTKTDNYNGCELNVGIDWNHIYRNGFLRISDNGTKMLGGPLYAILTNLAKQHNFKINLKTSPPFDFDLTFAGMLNYFPKLDKPTLFHITTTFGTLHWILITTLGEHYTPLEKMLKPFDNMTWLGIGVVAVGALILIFVIEHAPTQLRNFLFGRRLRTPVINLLIGIMGGTQVALPRRLWARILLTVYLFMCLIVRNAYQQKTFEYLVGDGRNPAPRTFEELVARDYPLYCDSKLVYITDLIESSRRPRVIIIESHEQEEILYKKPNDPSFKGAYLTTTEVFLQWKDNYRPRNFLWKPLEEIILSDHVGFLMTHNSDYYFDTLDQGIKDLLPTGMIDKGNIELDKPIRKKPAEDEPKKVLSMTDLELGFRICMICLAISFAVFILEHVKFRLFDRKRERTGKRPKLDRRNAIRRKIMETAIVVEDLEGVGVRDINE